MTDSSDHQSQSYRAGLTHPRTIRRALSILLPCFVLTALLGILLFIILDLSQPAAILILCIASSFILCTALAGLHFYIKMRGYELSGKEYTEATSKYFGKMTERNNERFGTFLVMSVIVVFVLPLWILVVSALARLILALMSPIIGPAWSGLSSFIVLSLAHVSAGILGYRLFRLRAKSTRWI